MEVPPRFELGRKGFADLGLTAWLWYHIHKNNGVQRVFALAIRRKLIAQGLQILTYYIRICQLKFKHFRFFL